MESKLIVSSSPHIKDSDNIKVIMYTVVASLVPSGIASVYFYGWQPLLLIITAIIASVATEAAMQKIMNKPYTILDGSAILTGLLLAYNLPPQVPLWIAAVGSVVAISIAKQVYGGLGQNPFNPALVGRVFLLLSWPAYMTTKWVYKVATIDVLSSATPLGILKDAMSADASERSLVVYERMMQSDFINTLFTGNISGCIGETSAGLLILGGAFLIYKKYVDWRIPATYLGSFALFIFIFGGKSLFAGPALFHLFAGGLMLGAFYMATDPVTSPMTKKGKIIFGVGCGIITAVIRVYGAYPEGVSFAILIMNAFTPLIDKYIKPDKFGVSK